MNQLENLPPFYVGQNVVCINDTDEDNLNPPIEIVKGNIYTVKGIYFDRSEWWIEINGFYWEYNAPSFAPLTESPFPSLTYERVIEKESVLTSMN